jgi:Flp pilus assembly protein TadG
MNTRQKFIATVRGFLRSERGNIAMLFAIALIPLMIGAGTGLDFARAMMVRQQMAESLDAAALAIGSTSGLDATSAQQLAQKYFDANYTVDTSEYGTVTINPPTFDAKGKVTLTATNRMPTVLMKLVNINDVPISTTSTVVWGQTKLWVALVLDNSGSMSSSNKMTGLKNASQQLLTILQNAASTPGDVKVGIVPFTNVINVGTGNSGAAWIDWTDWAAAPKDATGAAINDTYVIAKTGVPFSAYGPGDDCPFTTTSAGPTVTSDSPFGFKCQTSSTNGASSVSTSGAPLRSPIPAAGICPSLNNAAYTNTYKDHLARYYNGCWSSTAVPGVKIQVSSGNGATCGLFKTSATANCTCSGANAAKVCKTQKWTHAWVPNAHSSWSNCVMDRAQDYDIQNTQPTGTSGFPATNPTSCVPATVTSLSYDFTTLSSQINAMTPNGSTNQAVGLANGWQMLTTGTPYATPALPANTARYIILLSDGLNTQDRWWGDSNEGTADDLKIDDRMAKNCTAAKADGVVIYSIYVNTGGNGPSAPLSNCATDASKYFVLTSSTEIVSTFNQIGQQITNVRVSM